MQYSIAPNVKIVTAVSTAAIVSDRATAKTVASVMGMKAGAIVSGKRF